MKACEEDGRNCAVAWWQSKSCQNQSPKRQLCSALAPAPKPPIDNCEKRKKKEKKRVSQHRKTSKKQQNLCVENTKLHKQKNNQ